MVQSRRVYHDLGKWEARLKKGAVKFGGQATRIFTIVEKRAIPHYMG